MKIFNKLFTNSVECSTLLINVFEKRRLAEYGNTNTKYSPIFIIGAPRTGSTILYQLLTHYFNVSYIDNLACKFHKNLFFGMWLSEKIFGNKSHNCFSSKHGNTWKTGGFHGPSECGQFWYRWLPRDHHFIDYDEITKEMVEGIRMNITAITNYFDKPLIFKNLNAGQRLLLLHKISPDARIIWIRRDIESVVCSQLSIRKQLDIGKNEWWSIMPPDYKDLLNFNEVEMVVRGVHSIEKQISKDLSLFDSHNIIKINYEELCFDREVIMQNLGERLKLRRRDDTVLPDMRYRDRKKFIERNIKKEISKSIKKLDWNFNE